MHVDTIIVGAGPVGLSLAGSLAAQGLHVALVDRLPLQALAAPAFDGREIALTAASVGLLGGLGAWAALRPGDISPLQAACVLNGKSDAALSLNAAAGPAARLATLVPNHRLREALFEAAGRQPTLRIFAGAGLARLDRGRQSVAATLTSGEVLRAPLLVAADSRLSPLRARLGIEAEMRDLGRAMLTFRVEHEADHRRIATEWFDHHRTIALLPLNGNVSSVVLTLPAGEIDRLTALDENELGERATLYSRGRLGRMRVASSRHAYPLLVTYARDFVGPRAALVGDAAVGMHPVTAHGFNFGLRGQRTLADAILAARRRDEDIGGAAVLRSYATRHRRATRPLYLATNALVRLYTDESPAGRLARRSALHAAGRLPFVRQAVSALLKAS